MNPIPVAIVRPTLSWRSALLLLVRAVIDLVVRVVLLVAAGRIIGFQLDFWDALVLAVAIRALFTTEGTYRAWTRDGAR